jgi:putative phosphoribosyl transferase
MHMAGMIMLFGGFGNRLHLKIKNREAAANILAEALKDVLTESERRSNSIVLGIPRGGVLMGYMIYQKLCSASFDIVIPRRISSPFNKELGIGAIMEDGTTFLNQDLIYALRISRDYIEKEKEVQKNEIIRRRGLYPIRERTQIMNRTVILVDDGAATGATVSVALKWIREQNPGKIIVALSVAPKETIKLLKQKAEHVEAIIAPKASNFRCVEQYYRSFDPVSDNEVIQIMEKE